MMDSASRTKIRRRGRRVLVLSICMGLAAASFGLYGVEPNLPPSFELKAENENIAFYFSHETGEFAVQKKASDTVWRSNPPGESSGRGLFSIFYGVPGKEQVEMNDHRHSVALEQFTVTRIQDGIRVKYTLGETYREIRTNLPQLISKERFETLILSKIEDEADRQFVLDNYAPVMIEKLPVETKNTKGPTAEKAPWWQFWKAGQAKEINVSSPEVFEQQLFGAYRLVSLSEKDREQQEILDDAERRLEQAKNEKNKSDVETLQKQVDTLKRQFTTARGKYLWKVVEKYMGKAVSLGSAANRGGFRADITSAEDLTPEDFYQLYDNPTYVLTAVASFDLDDMFAIVKETGYSLEDLKTDHMMYRLDPPIPAIERFDVVAEYKIENDSLVVRLPMEDVRFPMNVPVDYRVNFDAEDDSELLATDESGAKESRPLYSISLLRFFGSAEQNAKGYIFVPDGSGSLIDLNSDKNAFPVYNEPVYGRDRSIPLEEALPYDKRVNHLPVFGIKQESTALFGVIEDGEAVAHIRANVARANDPLNVVYPSFTIMTRLLFRSLHTTVTIVQKAPYRGDIKVRYFFLEGDDATYSGMARTYRSYLVEKHGLDPIAKKTSFPFYLDVVGAISDIRTVGLFPVRVSIPLTTFEEARTLALDLQDSGVSELLLRYSGWLDGGVHHHYPRKASHDGVLGRKNEFIELSDFVSMNAGAVFPDVSLSTVYRNTGSDGFNESRDAARFINRLPAKLPEFNVITQKPDKETDSYVLSPKRLDGLVDDFLEAYGRYGISALSIEDLGSKIDSDFREQEEKLINRQESYRIVLSQLEKLNRAFDGNIMADQGSVYAAMLCKHIINMPASHTGVGITDREIPFYQMVLHGYVNYCGEAVNLTGDPEKSMLKAIETGAYPHFTWFFRDASLVKGTDYHYLFDAHYTSWWDRALSFYRRAEDVLGPLQGLRIVDHRELRPEIYQTEYEDGTVITVNYGEDPVEIDGEVIEGLDFIAGGSEAR